MKNTENLANVFKIQFMLGVVKMKKIMVCMIWQPGVSFVSIVTSFWR